jgi:lipopolysaccharide biosynthesis glycosyltransferase
MNKTDTISIVVASDNHYAILIAALLKSLDVNHKSGEHIDFYIIDDGISDSFRAKLESIVEPSRFTIKWFKSKSIIPNNLHIPVDTSSFPLTAYLRIFSPYVVDESLERLLYLDVDTIVRDDISKLWNMDLGDYTIAVAQDVGKTMDCAWGGVPNYAELGFTADTKYFNSGVMLMNPKKWREENISSEVITALVKYKEHVRLADQYGLNVVMANRWKQIDPLWNWFAFQEDQGASLIHFLDIKPIFKSYNSQPGFKDEFFKYLAMTPWKNFKPISGNNRQFRKIYNKLKKAVMRLT